MQNRKKKIAIILAIILILAVIGVFMYTDIFVDEYTLNLQIEGEGELQPESGTHEFSEGEVIEIEAISAEGWRFSEWQGDITGEEAVIEVEMTEDKEMTAVFTREEYSLEIDYDEEQGTVDIEPEKDEYELGETVSLRAEPAAGWVFTEWQGDIESYDQEIEITMEEDIELSLVFATEDYSLDIDYEEDIGTVEVEPEQEYYEHGQEVELRAEPETGYRFERWQGDVEGEDPVLQLEITEGMEIEPVFVREEYTLDLTIEGEGEIDWEVLELEEVEIDEIEPEEAGTVLETESLVLPHGTVFRLEAEAATGSEFSEWQGDITGEGAVIEVEMTEDKEITAVFTREEYSLEIDYDEEQGTVDIEPEKEYYYFGDRVNLEAVAADNYEFAGWYGDIEGEDIIKEIIIDENKQVLAEFTLKQFELQIEYDEAAGTIELEPDRAHYHYGEEIVIRAIPEEGWTFDRWEGDISGPDKENEIMISDNMDLQAVFVQEEYDFHVNYDEEKGEIQIDPEKDHYEPGDYIYMTAQAKEGYEFAGWEGDVESDDPELNIEVEEDLRIRAEFVPERYQVHLEVLGVGDVKLEPEQEYYYYDDEITIRAIPDAGWEFMRWSGDINGEESERTISVTEDMNIEVRFRFEK